MTDEWATPQALFDKLDREFHFTLDAAALHENAKVANFYSPEQNSLQQTWRGTVWLNPPYGREIEHWMKKAYESSSHEGTTVVCLVPNRTNAPWWHLYCMHAAEIRFVVKKVPFTGRVKGVPFFGSCVVVFRWDKTRPTVSSYSWER